jgi:hypothetical protein
MRAGAYPATAAKETGSWLQKFRFGRPLDRKRLQDQVRDRIGV